MLHSLHIDFTCHFIPTSQCSYNKTFTRIILSRNMFNKNQMYKSKM